jgi:hypothetical protein
MGSLVLEACSGSVYRRTHRDEALRCKLDPSLLSNTDIHVFALDTFGKSCASKHAF